MSKEWIFFLCGFGAFPVIVTVLELIHSAPACIRYFRRVYHYHKQVEEIIHAHEPKPKRSPLQEAEEIFLNPDKYL